MQINEEFWGAKENWYSDPTLAAYKRLPNTLFAMLNNGDIPFNEQWDLSISPWAINKNADIVKRGYPIISIDNGVINARVAPCIDTDDNSGIPFYFYANEYQTSGNEGLYFQWSARNAYNVAQLEDNNVNRYRDEVYVCTDFDYSRLCYYVCLVVADYKNPSNPYQFWAGSNWTVDNYISAWQTNPESVNPVIGIRFVPHYASYPAYPNSRENRGDLFRIKTLANFLPIDVSSATIYNEDFLDYFINLNATYSASAGYGLGICDYYGLDIANNAHTESEIVAQNYNANNEYPPMMLSYGDNWDVFAYNGGGRVYVRNRLKTENFATAEEFKEYIATQAAYLGCWFTFSADVATSGVLSSATEGVYLPEINNNGITTGNYATGNDINNLPNSTWTDNPFEQSGYEGRGGDPNTYDDNTSIINGATYIYNNFTRQYILTDGELASVATALFNKIGDTDSNFYTQKELFVNDPLNAVNGLMFFPFNIANFQTDEASTKPVIFGRYDTQLTAQVNRQTTILIDFGKVLYYPRLGVDNFLSYPPYSSAVLYIPYCGSVDIDPNLYLNHYVGVKMLVDMTTGAALALIYRDNMVVDNISGQVGISFPISGIQLQTFQAAVHQAEAQQKTAKNSSTMNYVKSGAAIVGGMVATVAHPVAGGLAIAGGMSSLLGNDLQTEQNEKNANFNLEHVQTPYKTLGTATAATSWGNEQKCRLIVRYPQYVNNYIPSEYGHARGFAVYKTGKLSEFSGYTECGSINLDGVSATAAEKRQIFKLLQGGVFI